LVYDFTHFSFPAPENAELDFDKMAALRKHLLPSGVNKLIFALVFQ
jgi:hypothetical protein